MDLRNEEHLRRIEEKACELIGKPGEDCTKILQDVRHGKISFVQASKLLGLKTPGLLRMHLWNATQKVDAELKREEKKNARKVR
ncbi:MAG: hypothetical protein DRN95_04695 [Candidatus Hydrothermarchaeota archaeon]|nr:MAG: hypothetical protein DRN95_04695 [Candidatus Hydrothermarchaeota archaeon]